MQAAEAAAQRSTPNSRKGASSGPKASDPVISPTTSITKIGTVPTPAKRAIIPTITRGGEHRAGEKLVDHDPERRAQKASDYKGGSEDLPRCPRPDRQRRRDDFEDPHQQEDHDDWQRKEVDADKVEIAVVRFSPKIGGDAGVRREDDVADRRCPEPRQERLHLEVCTAEKDLPDQQCPAVGVVTRPRAGTR